MRSAVGISVLQGGEDVNGIHELKARPGLRLFAEDGLCLSESYTKKLPRGKQMRVRGIAPVDCEGRKHSDLREMVLCEHTTLERICFYFADLVTGTLYSPHTGKCMSSGVLRLEVSA